MRHVVEPSAEQLSAIRKFFDAVRKLRDVNVIRSHRFLGDLGEFVCACTFEIALSRNQREQGLDGYRGTKRVQVKYHGGKSTTAGLGNPKTYDEVYLVLGPESVLREKGDSKDFLVYKFSSQGAKKHRTRRGKFQISKGRLPTRPTRRISMI
jgi:hypothetical protein